MRIVATTTDRTFYLDHGDLCAAWGVQPSRDGVINWSEDGNDLVYSRRDYLGIKYDLVERDGVAYFWEKPLHNDSKRDNVRGAVECYLRHKFRVKSAITVTVALDGAVIALCGLY